ncbi:MAG: dihydrofolate reductase family protein [Bacteroidota bacterium]
MGKVVLYIAVSLDGYIARPDGNLDWLFALPNPGQIDHGYAEFLSTIGDIVMGRSTYNEIIGFDMDWPYKGINTYVISNNTELKLSSPGTFLLSDGIPGFIDNLKTNSPKDIWLTGGGKLVACFLAKGLIDRMILSLIPVILGEGIPLFPGKLPESGWALSNVESFTTGVVSLTYDKK